MTATEIERAKRASKPWLFSGAATSTNYGCMASIGLPIAVKLGVSVGRARRREQLRAAHAHTIAALECGIDQ